MNKKMKKIFGLIGLMMMATLILFGCGKEKNVTYTGELEKIPTEFTFTAKGDVVKKQVMTMKMPLAEIGGKESVGLMKAVMKKQFDETYGGIKGVTLSSKETDKELLQIVTLDFEKIDKDDLKKINDDFDGKSDKVSLKKTAENLEKKGFKEKK